MNEVVFFVACVISVFYLILILLLTVGINKLKVFKGFNVNQQKSFSIIVPFRNEFDCLGALLESFKNLQYSSEKFEIILVNDASKDASVLLVENFILHHPTMQIRLLQNDLKAISPKKEAIDKALKIAQYDWIITTDADCIVPNLWLKTIDEFIDSTTCDMVVSPVIFTTNKSWLQEFQQIDFLSLMGATQGGFGIGFPFLCNGANLCYSKAVFNEVGGFEGNTTIASGDDIFLMEKFLKRNPSSVKYLKSIDAIVQTEPQKTIKEFINQRIRWASKTTAYENNSGKLVGIIVLSMNLWLFLSFLFLFLKWISLAEILLFWILKIGIDYSLILALPQFYQTRISVKKYLIFSFIYPFYTVIVGFLSLKKGYVWKGRRFLR